MVIFYFYSLKKISCVHWSVAVFQIIKQRAYLFPESIGQLSNANIGFVPALLLLIEIPVNCAFKF